MAVRKRYKSFTFTPSSGGRLMASISKDTVGIKNYLTKRNFRRLLDREQRREGYDYFAPKDYIFNGQFSQTPLYLVNEINLVHMARRPDGDTTVIVGTNTGHLIRYEGTKEVRFFSDTRDSDHDVAYFEDDGDATPGEPVDTWGIELLSGNYSAGIKNVSTTTGEEYYFTKGLNETSLVNGGETLTASGFFKAQGSSIVLNGRGGLVITGSLKKHNKANDYAISVPSEWVVIYTPDSNSVNRKRWEAININGYTVFNNGADLPLVYRGEWDSAIPIYALREAGVARVGSIAELNGILVCGDISQIRVKEIDNHMKSSNPYGYYTGPVDRIGYRVLFSDLDDPTSFGATAKATIFKGATEMSWKWKPSSLGNDEIIIIGAGAGGGNLTANIVGSYAKPLVNITIEKTYNEGDYSIGIEHNNEGTISTGLEVNGEGTASGGLVTAHQIGEIINFNSGSAIQLTSNAAVGDSIIFGKLIGSVFKGDKGTTATKYVKLDKEASTSVFNTEVARSNAFSSTSGFDDLQDDGSKILKMVKLQNVLVIYKETSIFIAEYTGSTNAPFRFNFIKVPAAKCLKFRHTVANVEGMSHIYAGASSFYSFDLSSRKPKEIPNIKNTDIVFFDNATMENEETIFATDNQLTKEIWFVTNKSTSSDKAMCYDYIFQTLSTTSIEITAGATVTKPGSVGDWFVMGDKNGIALTYGLTNERNSRWGNSKNYFLHRGDASYNTTGEGYDSVLESGAEDFGDSFGEKDMRSFVLHLAHTSESPSTRLDISGYHNVGDVLSGSASSNVLDTRIYDDPDTKNLFPVYYKQNYFQDKITVSTGNLQYAGKTYEIAGVNSKSFVRTDDA